MSRRNKLVKFTELLTFPNVFECYEPLKPELVVSHDVKIDLQTDWTNTHFNNKNPLTLELACGHGDYSISLAERYPNRNIIGVDVKGARIWRGATKALENNYKNVAFVRTRIEVIDAFFQNGKIDQIWITFPDPFLKASKYNRRLTSPNFLKKFKTILKPDGLINLKTDSPEFYAHTQKVFLENDITPLIDEYDIYALDELPHPDLDIKTHYELQHLRDGRKIKFVQFQLTDIDL